MQWNVGATLYELLEVFTCVLYGCKDSITQVNEACYHLFSSKKGEIESHLLPPYKDCLYKHIKGANYQTGI